MAVYLQRSRQVSEAANLFHFQVSRERLPSLKLTNEEENKTALTGRDVGKHKARNTRARIRLFLFVPAVKFYFPIQHLNSLSDKFVQQQIQLSFISHSTLLPSFAVTDCEQEPHFRNFNCECSKKSHHTPFF